jgi:hypothetical protein
MATGKGQQVSRQIAADKWHLPAESLWDDMGIIASKRMHKGIALQYSAL